MFIWLAMLIPVVTGLVLYFRFDRETIWWELLIPFGVSAVLCLGSKALVEKVQTADTEFWAGWAVRAEYYEDWNERVSCRHTKYRTNSKGHRVPDGTEHAYDVDYHPPYWQVIDSNNLTVGIDRGTFEKLCHKFGNRQFVDLHRNFHTKDGDMYQTVWSGDDLRLEPVVTAHSYENRVKASTSVFKFAAVDPKVYGLFDYPAIQSYYEQRSILGDGGMTQPTAERLLQKWNAKIGATKQVRLFVLVFRDQPIQAGFDQQNYWQNGNKNEFVVTIGVNKQDEIQWCHPFSWTEVESLKIETRDFVMGQKRLDLEKLVNWLVPEVQGKFQRKHFKDFSYLTVEPPMWAVGLTFLLTCMVNFGVGFWIVQNEHREGQTRGFKHGSYYY